MPESRFQFLIGSVETQIQQNLCLISLSFNSSQVVWKLSIKIATFPNIATVSIPHRQCGNKDFFLFFFFLVEVSIPHRQCGNGNNKMGRYMVYQGFQFLIGSVETFLLLPLAFLLGGFNSSQVVWKLSFFQSLPQQPLEFQFLIGSVETLSILTRIFQVQVSIPHRQCGNGKGIFSFPHLFRCFNSSQVVWKLYCCSRCLFKSLVSIPHRQCGNTLLGLLFSYS